MLGWLYLRASAPPTGIYKRIFCCSSATFGTLFPIFVRWVPLYFSTFPKLAFFGLPTVCWGRRRDVATAKVAFGRTCCFSTVFAAAFLVAGGVASSVSSLFFTAGDFPIPVSYFFPGDAGRGGRCGGSHGREGGGEGQSVPPSRAPVFVLPRGSVWNSKHSTMIKGSPAFKEEQGSKTECCIERRVHQKNKDEDRPCRRPDVASFWHHSWRLAFPVDGRHSTPDIWDTAPPQAYIHLTVSAHAASHNHVRVTERQYVYPLRHTLEDPCARLELLQDVGDYARTRGINRHMIEQKRLNGSEHLCRATWSSCNHISSSIINHPVDPATGERELLAGCQKQPTRPMQEWVSIEGILINLSKAPRHRVGYFFVEYFFWA